MTHFGAWATFAETNDLNQLVHMIATGRDADTVLPDAEIASFVADLPPSSRVLDFGCGVCRNAASVALANPGLEVVGYDSPQMLHRAGEFLRHRYGSESIANLTLCSDWASLASQRFDLVYATLVFQHVPPDEIRQYLSDVQRMSPRLIVHGRRKNDHCSQSTWAILESCGLVPANAAEIGYAAAGPDEEHLPPCVYEIA